MRLCGVICKHSNSIFSPEPKMTQFMSMVMELGERNFGRRKYVHCIYESFATVGEIRVYRRADFQSGSRVLKKVF